MHAILMGQLLQGVQTLLEEVRSVVEHEVSHHLDCHSVEVFIVARKWCIEQDCLLRREIFVDNRNLVVLSCIWLKEVPDFFKVQRVKAMSCPLSQKEEKFRPLRAMTSEHVATFSPPDSCVSFPGKSSTTWYKASSLSLAALAMARVARSPTKDLTASKTCILPPVCPM